MDQFLRDLRHSLRALGKAPGFTLVAILTLMLGIGANTAIFTIVKAILLDPLPFSRPDRVMLIQKTFPQKGIEQTTAFPDFEDWRREAASFEAMAAVVTRRYTLLWGDEPEPVNAMRVSSDFMPMLDVKPLVGRIFRAEEDSPAAEPVAIISERLWRRRLGARTDVVNQTLRLDGRQYRIVGVLPARADFPPNASELWIPLALTEKLSGKGNHYLSAIGRLKPGVSRATAQAEMDLIAKRLGEAWPQTNKDWGISVKPLHESLTRIFRPALLVLFATVGLVLLIACANVANLMMVRCAERSRGLAIRAALGASRFNLVRQVLAEAIAVSVAGGGLGVLVAWWVLRLLTASLPEGLPVPAFHIDSTVLGFTLGLSVLTGIVFGAVPALRIRFAALSGLLKQGSRGSLSGVDRSWTRRALIVSEMALAVLLLVAAGLLIKSFRRLMSVDPGFVPENVLTFRLSLPSAKYTSQTQALALNDSLLSRVRNLPGVQSAGAASFIPMTGNSNRAIAVQGRVSRGPEDWIAADFRPCTPGYFEAVRMRLRRGRAFTDRDNATGPPVAIVNETMARRYWPGQDPIGKRLALNTSPTEIEPWREVVGVVVDIRHSGLDSQSKPELFVPLKQVGYMAWSLHYTVRTASHPAGSVAGIRAEVRDLDREQPLADLRTMDEVIARSVTPQRVTTVLLGSFAGLALILAVVGLYGVVSHSVTQRTQELGIRIALGADAWRVTRMVIGESAVLVSAGAALGVAGAYGVTRLMAKLLFGVSPHDTPIFVGIPILLCLVALAASYSPARRATKVDPVAALRSE